MASSHQPGHQAAGSGQLTDGLQGLCRLHGHGVDPALQARAWRDFDDIRGVNANVEAQHQRHRCGFELLFLAPLGHDVERLLLALLRAVVTSSMPLLRGRGRGMMQRCAMHMQTTWVWEPCSPRTAAEWWVAWQALPMHARRRCW